MRFIWILSTRARLTPSMLLTVLLATAVSAQTSATRPSFAEPALSPDRSEIAFVSGSDIWTVPAAGGEARLLVSHAANESRPIYSPDGKRLAFLSSRSGNGDIYVLTFASGELARITFDDVSDNLESWSRDGRWLYFSSTSRDIAGMPDVFRVRSDGGTPMQVSADRYTSEFFSSPSPDGNSLAISAHGVAAGQWWRHGHSHLDEAQIWLVRDGTVPKFEQVTAPGARELWPMWGADGSTLYYVSDRTGPENIWTRAAGGQPRPVTTFTNGRVLFPRIAYDGRALVFERDFGIWMMDLPSGAPRQVPITLRGAPAGTGVEHLVLSNGLQKIALSPDGKKLAFIVRGEVFATSAKDGGDASRVTTTPANEFGLAWAPDSRRLVYSSDRGGAGQLYLYDFGTRTETQLTRDSLADVEPTWSPDGSMIVFARGGRELRVYDVAAKRDRLLVRANFDKPPFLSDHPFEWSPDGKWIAYLSDVGARAFTNAYIIPAAGGDARQVSFLANSFAGTLSWSPDGTFLLLSSGQRTEPGQLLRIDLVPRTPRFREDQFRDLFGPEPAKPAPKPDAKPDSAAKGDSAARPRKGTPTEIVFTDIRRRLTVMPIGVDIETQRISPDGKSLAMIASAAGQTNVYLYSLDDLARDEPVAKQITTGTGNKQDLAFTPDGKEIYFRENGRVQVVPTDGRPQRNLAVSAELDVDFAKEKHQIFRQAWSYLDQNFFDEKFNGVNWSTLRDEYTPLVAGAQTVDELRRILGLMIGELNASHTGIGGPAPQQPHTGRLGLRFDRNEYETAGKLRITEIIPLSPAGLIKDLKVGDYLLAVNDRPIDARTNLDALLANTIGKQTMLTIASSAEGAARRTVPVRPSNAATEKALLYRKWVEENRAYVAKASGGRLGYVHMFDMSAGSLAQLYVDLDAENHTRDGVVVDVRNNNGGFVNVYAIDVFTRRSYITMQTRGYPDIPARTQLGQRSLELPTVLITNQHSLSDAEDFTEGYRALKLGKVVGEPTSGWIVYTSNVTLSDGTTLRLPSTKIFGTDGKLMEMNPRPVDIPVSRPLGETYTGRDSQLDAAVKQLLSELGDRKSAGTK